MAGRIAFLTHSFGYGGAEKYIYDFVRYCCAEGHTCLIIGPRSGPNVEQFRALGVQLVSIPLTSIMGTTTCRIFGQFLKILLNTIHITKILINFKPTLVYTNTCTIISGACAAYILNVPHYWHVHENFNTMDISLSIPYKALQLLMDFLSVNIIFVSNLAMTSLYPQGSPKALVVQNGVDLATFHFRTYPIRGRNRHRICFVGALAARKGLDILLQALAYIKPTISKQIDLDIWGSGDPNTVAALTILADELGLHDSVRFMGYGHNLHKILPLYDVLVVPSRGESFSLVTIEGMAVGVPVVATRCGGPEEIIADGTNGILLDIDDYSGMGRAIKRVLEDPRYAEQLARNAYKTVSQHFDSKQQFKKLSTLILPQDRDSL